MKRFIMILLVAAMALTMVACGKEVTSSESSLPNKPISESTPVDTDTSDGQEGTGGDSLRWTNYKYEDRLTSIDRNWDIYVTEKTGKDLGELWKTEWKTEEGAPFSMLDIIYELDIPREMFVEDNNKKIANLRESDWDYLTDEVIFRDYCFTDEEIDAIYSRDKKRIAEAFAFPYAVVADNWELYPLRWIIDNPATLYKERDISLEAIQKSVDKIIEDGLVGKADKEALLARIEEYKKLL